MKIIFEYGKRRIILPVNPESLRINRQSASQKVNVVGLGQVSIPQSPDLISISINSFFWGYLFDLDIKKRLIMKVGAAMADKIITGVADNLTEKEMIAQGYDPQEVKNAMAELKNERKTTSVARDIVYNDADDFQILEEYVYWFQEWQTSKQPARFTVMTMPIEPNLYLDLEVTCEKFDYWVVAGQEGDYYYELNLLEWKNYAAVELNTQTDEGGNIIAQKNNVNNRIDTKETESEKKTKPKDSVWGIARETGNGEGDDWKALYNKNQETIAQDPTNANDDWGDLKIPTREEYLQSGDWVFY